MTIILGIDPGLRKTGYGLIKINGHQMIPLDFGCICPPAKLTNDKKYLILFEGVEFLIEKWQPTAVAVENQFFDKNFKTALSLGVAKGMALLAAARAKIPVSEYPPNRVKKAVAGGHANKEQIQKMIMILLGLAELPQPEDAADALAVAICHFHTNNVIMEN